MRKTGCFVSPTYFFQHSSFYVKTIKTCFPSNYAGTAKKQRVVEQIVQFFSSSLCSGEGWALRMYFVVCLPWVKRRPPRAKFPGIIVNTGRPWNDMHEHLKGCDSKDVISKVHNILSLCISVPKRQNPVPLHLVKMRYRALKFLVHFNSVLPTKVPQRQSKVGIHQG